MTPAGHNIRRTLATVVALPFVVTTCLAVFLLWQLDRFIDASHWVDHTDQVISESNVALKMMVDLESGFRGFLLTGKQEFLQPYRDAESKIDSTLDQLATLVSDNSQQLDRLRRISVLYGEWHSYAARYIAQRAVNGPPTGERLGSDENKKRMDGIRAEFSAFIVQETYLRDQRAGHAQHTARVAEISSGLFLLGVTFVLAAFSRREMLVVASSYEQALRTIAQDVEDQKRVQAELRNSRERLAGIIDSAMDAIISVDERQTIVVFNRAAEEIFRCPASQAIGRPLETFIPERFRQQHRHDLTAFGSDGVTSRSMYSPGQLVGLRSDGEEFPIEASISQVQADGQKLYTVILRDITERVRAEDALRNSDKLAVTGKLAASIAHEINNPMASVTNLLYLLNTDPQLPDRDRNFVRLAQKEVERMSAIVRQMLGFYREATHPVAVDLPAVVRETVDLYEFRARNQGVTVEAELGADGEVFGFPGELRQVISNLLINAVEAVGKGGRILIRVHPAADFRDSNRPGVRVVVADNGPGIPADTRAKIFDPFFTTKGERGTGLGLWVTNGIVEKHGGHIQLRTSTRTGCSGTVFSIYFPRERRRGDRSSAA